MMHLARPNGTLTRCGRPDQATTLDADQVECLHCLKMVGRHSSLARSQSIKKAMRRPSYGDETFAGAGKLRCRNCGRPYVEHPIAVPCPF